MPDKYDCFISHASEDKSEFVEPLARELIRLGVSTWYDRFSLTVGDSLSRSIDKGLSKSRYGILVISKAFISKPWPEYELRGLNAKEIGAEKVILPIWHGVTREDVLSFSPTLADKFAIPSGAYDINYIVRELVRVIRPDIADALHRIEAFKIIVENAEKKTIPLNKLKPNPTLRHETLKPEQMVRIRLVRSVLAESYARSLEDTILDFKRDLNIDTEILIWEAIAAAYSTYKTLINPELEELKEVLGGFITISTGNGITLGERKHKYLDSQRIQAMLAIWANLGTEFDFENYN